MPETVQLERVTPMDESEIRGKLETYNFYHVIKLTEHIQTPGWAPSVPIVELVLRGLRSLDFKNKRVLDIGCRDGILSFEAEKLGAREVIGIDNDLSRTALEFLIPYFKSKVKMYELNIFDLTPQIFGMFDVVIFSGVLYHLRYPFWALKLIKDVLHETGQLIIETALLFDDNKHAMLFCPIGSDSPYEPTSCTFFNLKGLTGTLYSLGLTVQRVEYLKTPPRSRTLKERLQFLGYHARKLVGRATKPVGRATLICTMTPQTVDATVSNYWNKTHRIHSVRDPRPS